MKVQSEMQQFIRHERSKARKGSEHRDLAHKSVAKKNRPNYKRSRCFIWMNIDSAVKVFMPKCSSPTRREYRSGGNRGLDNGMSILCDQCP